MRIKQEMQLTPSKNGHILSAWLNGKKEINLPEQLTPGHLFEAVVQLQVIIDKAEAPAG